MVFVKIVEYSRHLVGSLVVLSYAEVSKELAVFVAFSSFNGAPCAKWRGTVDWLLPGCKMWSTNHRPLSRQLPGLSVSGTAEFRRGGPSAAWNKLRRFCFSFFFEK